MRTWPRSSTCGTGTTSAKSLSGPLKSFSIEITVRLPSRTRITWLASLNNDAPALPAKKPQNAAAVPAASRAAPASAILNRNLQ